MQKPQQLGVLMAVCKQNKDYTSNPHPYIYFKPDIILWAICYEITGKSILNPKKDVGMGLLVYIIL